MAVKKENESKKQAADCAPQHGDSQIVHKTRRDIVNERIGYDPRAVRETTVPLPRPLHWLNWYFLLVVNGMQER